ncbi:hypothetical protein M0P48_03030 [Candidatus Gracilibacteria bacterium]|nr:hypothetical protein [Candidatus Gracilibacteria bacterium]
MPVPKDVTVSHKISGDVKADCVPEKSAQPLKLSGKNHAWWIGKIPKRKGERRDCIYSPEFIQASLEVLFGNLEEGEIAQIVMAPCFSKYFNGVEDRELGLSDEEAKAFIMKIVNEKFPSSLARIEIHCVEEMPLHKELFQRVESAFDKKEGVCDIERAFGKKNDAFKNPTSLDIARLLYRASRDNFELFQFFRNAAPGKLRPDYDAKPCPSDYYALAEVSVRLAEILNGRTIHGGADRQGKYDDFIKQIVEMANAGDEKPKRKKNFLFGLEPLIELFKGKRFETVHLDTGKNPYKMKVERTRAKTRLALGGALSAAAIVLPIAGGYAVSEMMKQHNVEQGREMMMDRLSEVLEGMCLTYDDCKFGVQRPESSFKNILNESLYQVSIRYSVPHDKVLELENLLLSFILSHQEFLSGMGDDNSRLIEFVDLFMNDSATQGRLAEMGINDLQVYGNLAHYKSELLKISKGGKQKREVSFGEREKIACASVPWNPDPKVGCLCDDVDSLGVFSPSELGSFYRYEVAVCTGVGGDVLVAKPDNSFGNFITHESDSDPHDTFRDLYYRTFYSWPDDPFSTKLVGDEFAKKYVDTLRKAEMVKIPQRMKDSLSQICNENIVSNFGNFDFSKLVFSTKGMELVKGIHHFKDPFSGEEWELFMASDCEKFQGKSGEKIFCDDVVLARKKGETDFTFVRAKDFAQMYMNTMRSHWRFPPECK